MCGCVCVSVYVRLRTKFQFGWKLGCTAPLDVLSVIASAFVLAAHEINGIFCANVSAGNAFQLGSGGGAPVGGLLVAAQGQGFDLGKKDGIPGLGRLGDTRGEDQEGEKGGGYGVEMHCERWWLE